MHIMYEDEPEFIIDMFIIQSYSYRWTLYASFVIYEKGHLRHESITTMHIYSHSLLSYVYCQNSRIVYATFDFVDM